jgi:hypothetical protein
MPVVLSYATADEIPEEFKSVAEEIKDGEHKGTFKVKVSPTKKIDEFRQRNVEQAERLEAAQAQAKALRKVLGLADDAEFDADKLAGEFVELKNTKKLVDDGKLTKSEAIEAEVEKRVATMKQSLEDARLAAVKVADAQKLRGDDYEAKYKRGFIDRDVYRVCTEADLGVEAWAVPYILQDAYGLFTVEGDDNSIKLTPKKNGSVLYGENGADPMTIKEWVNTEVRKSAPHFFKKSNGGGAAGGDGSGDKGSMGGFTAEAFSKLPPEKRLEIANASLKKGARR